MYGGSNELFGKNQNFPLFLNIKLHLKMPVNFNFLNNLSFLGELVPPPSFSGHRRRLPAGNLLAMLHALVVPFKVSSEDLDL